LEIGAENSENVGFHSAQKKRFRQVSCREKTKEKGKDGFRRQKAKSVID
jgi:hypothetical protein